MSYSMQADLIDQLSEAILIQLTDDAGIGTVDVAKVTGAIADADAEIDSYAGSRYTTPFSPVPAMIRKISVDIAIYNLSSRSVLEMPEERRKRYENAIRYLRDLAKGVISLGADAPAEPDAELPQATRAKDDRIFTIGKASDGSVGSLDNY